MVKVLGVSNNSSLMLMCWKSIIISVVKIVAKPH